MVYFINYGDNNFNWTRMFSALMARFLLGLRSVYTYRPNDIDRSFFEKHRSVLQQQRGGGYWLWKPYFILKTLQKVEDNDWILYLDSGGFLYADITPLINIAEKIQQPVVGFELPLIERQWTKRELSDSLGIEDELLNKNQIMATMFLIKKNSKSVKFFEEFLTLCENTNLLNDSIWLAQEPSFIEHRHDQSIFSLLYKKYRFTPFGDISQRGAYSKTYCGCVCDEVKKADKTYILNNHRFFRKNSDRPSLEQSLVFLHKTNSPIKSLVKFIIKKKLGKLSKFRL